jgi:uncharacterized membrane protein YhaH (DUF805 family)
VSGPYSPYGAQGGGPYDPSNGGQYGAPSGGQYGAPSGGQYGAPSDGQYNQYGQPAGSPYGAPGGYPQQRGYLQGGPVDFQSAIKLQLGNVTNFQGRASLSAYWWWALGVFVIAAVLEIFSFAVGSAAFSLLIDLVMVAVGLSGLSLAVRRLHDSNKSGWLLLLDLIPFLGAIIVLILMVLPGTPNQNRFG